MFTGTLLLVFMRYGGLSSLIVVSDVSCSLLASGTKFVFLYCYMASIFVVSCGV
ncbi:hypothetical protein BC941DRAFT_443847 [Chlamydoabsidia padenii]|nr:hypothetical protein BC941DRAFT_443847 [Chlamydoabsidia padenii]